jgi:queuine tRNA-ribosyltransferase
MFEITHKDGKARCGILTTNHGKVQTPFFMPVASRGTVKSISSEEILDLGYESIISNSFILSLYPGIDVVKKLGGIHKFMNFKKTIFTDSGGFQVLSKDFLLKKTDEGVLFKDRTGKKSKYTPEIAIKNQFDLGSDVAMTFDDVAHYGLNGKDYVDAIKRTHHWAKRCLTAHSELKAEYGGRQLLFGISQGGTKSEYRRFSTTKINKMDFDGYALGGLVVGEKRGELFDTIKEAVKCFDEHKIKYLMGLGSPPDIVWAVGLGVDCFDSIYPTSNARHGSLITKKGRIDIFKKKYLEDENSIDEGCKCEVCKNYSRAYLHHLFKNHELLGYKLATIHNLFFMEKLVTDLRNAIKKGKYAEFSEEFLKEYFSGTESKEFSSNIKEKYMEKEIKEGARFLLEWKK